MDLQGSHKFSAPPQQVWNALMDPTVLKDVIPGAKDVTINGSTVSILVHVGLPMINGDFEIPAQIVTQNPPQQLVLNIDRSGSQGSIKGQVTINLAADGTGTDLTYNAHIDRSGAIGMAPDMVVKPIAEQGLKSLFKNLDSKI